MTGVLLFAATLNVGSLPPIDHSDCEVSTNVVLATSPDMSEMGFTLSLSSTPSNVVEVAFGTDFKIISRGRGHCFRSLNVNQSNGRFYIIVR